jgi:hypothetical protein
VALTSRSLAGKAAGHRARGALLAVCAVAQLAFFAWSVAPRLARANREVELYASDEPPGFAVPAVWAFRSLPAVARQIPAGARTLLLSMVIDPIQFEFYFVPRPFRQLQWFPPKTVDLAAQKAPEHAHLFAARLQQMAERRILYSPARLEEELAWCEFLVVFAPHEAAVPDLPPRVQPVSRHGPASLYRVAPQ